MAWGTVEQPSVKVRGTAGGTRYILWKGVVFEKVGTREEAGLPDGAFPPKTTLIGIDVDLCSEEKASHFKGRRGRR